MKKQKLPVTARALLQRINRKLRPHFEQVRTTRSERLANEFGRYYRMNWNRNYVAQRFVDIEALGRDLGVLAPFEALDKEEG
jgi:hypothetical protein